MVLIKGSFIHGRSLFIRPKKDSRIVGQRHSIALCPYASTNISIFSVDLTYFICL